MQGMYHCYALLSGTDGQYGASFMNYLANGEEVSFTDIQNDIYYLLAAGSKVVDVIGYGEDNKGNDYNFDFVDDIGELTLTVGGKALDKTELIDPQLRIPMLPAPMGSVPLKTARVLSFTIMPMVMTASLTSALCGRSMSRSATLLLWS